jgi:hypothetical protein
MYDRLPLEAWGLILLGRKYAVRKFIEVLVLGFMLGGELVAQTPLQTRTVSLFENSLPKFSELELHMAELENRYKAVKRKIQDCKESYQWLETTFGTNPDQKQFNDHVTVLATDCNQIEPAVTKLAVPIIGVYLIVRNSQAAANLGWTDAQIRIAQSWEVKTLNKYNRLRKIITDLPDKERIDRLLLRLQA